MTAEAVISLATAAFPFDTVIETYLEGANPEEIVRRFDTLQLAAVYHLIGYYYQHREQVRDYLRVRHQEAEQIREQNQARFPASENWQSLLRERGR